MRRLLILYAVPLLLGAPGHAQIVNGTQSQIGIRPAPWVGQSRRDDNPNVRTNGNEPPRQYDRMGRACPRTNTMTNKPGGAAIGADPTACGFDRNGNPIASALGTPGWLGNGLHARKPPSTSGAAVPH